MRLFGLTGGMASGKSTVAKRFAARGLPVIDADQVAREVVLPGSPGLQAVVERFGAGVLNSRGELDRRALGDHIFGHPAERRALEGLLHPRISARTSEIGQELARAGVPAACYDAALLVEKGLADAFRPLVVVVAPEATQIERIMQRDRLSFEEAKARVEAQGSPEAKVRAANHVIENGGSLEDLLSRADTVFDDVCRELGLDPATYPKPRRGR